MFRFQLLAALVTAVFGTSVAAAPAPASLDDVVVAFMADEAVPGAAVAAADGAGRSILRTYGVADAATGRPVKADTAFRLASLSKPITAAAVMALVDRRALALDDRLADLLPLPAAQDPRFARITVRHLLRHAAGWDRARDFDPLLDGPERRRRLGLGTAPDCGPVAYAMLASPLQSEPGGVYAYSNLGYCFLELIVAHRSGESYAGFVSREILAPRGAGGLRLGEADIAPERLASPSAVRGRIPTQDEIVQLGGAGGWIGTAAEVLAFLGPRPAAQSDPPADAAAGTSYHDLGWRIWPGPDGSTLTHYGALDGSFALALRFPDAVRVVALFNARPRDDAAAFERLRRALSDTVRAALGPSAE